MTHLSPKERLLDTLAKKPTDRPPVICPGGMMNATLVDVMNASGTTLPAAHHDAPQMAQLAADVNRLTGFENFGIPFCMTAEAEVMGSPIDFGSLVCEPKIKSERYASVSQVEELPIAKLLREGRIETILAAGSSLAKTHADVPLIGNLTGPVSAAASLVDPMTFLKELRKDPANAHRVMSYVTDFLVGWARLMAESGFDLISIADPTATGEILGPRFFAEYGVTYLNRLVDAIHEAGLPVIVHICGDVGPVKAEVARLKSNAVSTDAMVSLKGLKAAYPELVVMGNLSTYSLEFSDPDTVSAQTQKLLSDRIDIIAPACGLSTSSPLANIASMTRTVREA